MTSLQPTQAQCLGCIRKGATVTTSSIWAVKLLGSYLIAMYGEKHTYTSGGCRNVERGVELPARFARRKIFGLLRPLSVT